MHSTIEIACMLTVKDMLVEDLSLTSIVLWAGLITAADTVVAAAVGVVSSFFAVSVSRCGTVFLRELNANFFLGKSSFCLAWMDCLSSVTF